MAELEDASDDGDEEREVFLGCFPAGERVKKKRRVDRGQPPSSAFLYSSLEHPPAPPPVEHDAEQEEALMRAMGLPTSLRPYTAAANGDDYKVVSADPAARLHEVSFERAAVQTSQSLDSQSADSAQSTARRGIPAEDAGTSNAASVLAVDGAHPPTSSTEGAIYGHSDGSGARDEQR